jgi:hypothetical protein
VTAAKAERRVISIGRIYKYYVYQDLINKRRVRLITMHGEIIRSHLTVKFKTNFRFMDFEKLPYRPSGIGQDRRAFTSTPVGPDKS